MVLASSYSSSSDPGGSSGALCSCSAGHVGALVCDLESAGALSGSSGSRFLCSRAISSATGGATGTFLL